MYIYLAVGLINILAKSNNYGIKINDTGMDIRVRRDINYVPIIDDIYDDSVKTDNVREIRQLPYNQNDKQDNGFYVNYTHNLTHNHTSHKRRSHNHGMYIPRTRSHHHKTTVNNSNNKPYEYKTDITGFKPDNLVLETEYNHHHNNQVNLQKRQTLPAPQPYSKPEENTSKPLYKKIWSFFSGSKTTTPKYEFPTPGVGNRNGVSAQLKKRKRKIIPACVLCDTGCPLGYRKQESYCISEDPDYE
ncbi:unnamed protein product [Arctia plantaginis]|uniref:Uncharacterized protein n=1 Tax=Arctia plantaginis TaxID=874455 RepID=A0A8S1B6P4_ARCPL|nr:unnamed protein product [Arctia plantaginis]